MYLFRNVELNAYKNIVASLANVFGLGCTKAVNILSKSCISLISDFAFINRYYWQVIYNVAKVLVVGSERIKRIAVTNISRLKDSKLYRGIRHGTYRPVRGQRSRTNANTQRAKGANMNLLKPIVRIK